MSKPNELETLKVGLDVEPKLLGLKCGAPRSSNQ